VRVLGIDPGTAACGYGVVDAGARGVAAVDHGWWKTSPSDPPELRLKRTHDVVAELIAKHEPDAVALEESYVGVDARTALFVGQARGAVLVACAAARVECAEYPPATVKQTVCGYGRADKQQVQRMVKAILGLADPPQPHHAADALAVALCHALAPPLAALVGARR
jgi:crossover junction endodeoxyribonuclease RuvC